MSLLNSLKKHKKKVLFSAAFLLFIGWMVDGVYDLHRDLLKVYDVPLALTYAPNLEEADIVVIDFNRYGCGACRELHPVLMEAIEQDGRVLYAPRTLVFEDEWQEFLVRTTYAAAAQGKMIEMHRAIYGNWPINSRQILFDIARDIGLDVQKLSRDISDPAFLEYIQESEYYFQGWGLSRTPSLLIGETSIYVPIDGLPTVEELLDIFEKSRS